MTAELTVTDVRTEYGAMTVTGNIYMHDFHAPTVQKFVNDFSDVCPITLVTRQWVGDTHTAWKEEGQ